MRYIWQNIKQFVRAAVFLLFIPALAVAPFARKFFVQKGSSSKVWVEFWERVWDRAGDLTKESRIDVAVLFSSLLLACICLPIACDPVYLDRYTPLAHLRDYPGGRPFWIISTGTLACCQFIAAFAYGMRGVNVRYWERACLMMTAVAAGEYALLHGLLSIEVEGVLSLLCGSLFWINLSYAVRFGVMKAVSREVRELEEVMARPRHDAVLEGHSAEVKPA